MLSIPLLENAVISIFTPEIYDDSFDRIHYAITSSIIGFFAIMISAKQYIGSPIQCWTYKEFSTSWEQYAEDYCFIKNTYYHPINMSLPSIENYKSKREINYYQWVPIILSIQAFSFYFPNVIWKYIHKRSNVNFNIIIEEACKLRKLYKKEKDIEKSKLADYIYDCFEILKFTNENYKMKVETKKGYQITVLYIIVKFLYILNVLFQIYYMNLFIGNGNSLWGFKLLFSIINKNEDMGLKIFPRVTFCDFIIKRLGNDHSYTLQCVLMVNMFNEKIFLFLWFWFISIFFISFLNIIHTFWMFIPEINRASQVKRYLKSEKLLRKNKYVIPFCREALKSDGVLLLSLIEGHAGSVITKEITIFIFKRYLKEINNINNFSDRYSTDNESLIENVPKKNSNYD